MWPLLVLSAPLLLVNGFVVHDCVGNGYLPLPVRHSARTPSAVALRARSRNNDREKPSNNLKTRQRSNASQHISMSNVTMELSAADEIKTVVKSQKVNAETPQRPQTAAKQFLRTVWKGMTLPFPALQDLGLQVEHESTTPTPASVGLSIQECIVAISIYLFTGVVAFSFVFEHWSFVDALYFSVTTFTTVGTGDVVPLTTAGRLFACVYGLGGIAFLGVVIATLGSELVSAEVEAKEMAQETSRQRVFDVFDTTIVNAREGDGGAEGVNGMKDQDESFQLNSSKPFVDSLVKCIRAVSFLLLGGSVMALIEGWDWPTALYYSIVTAGTIGYGDVAASTPEGRAWAIVFIPLAVACAGEVLGNVASAVIDSRQREMYRFLESQDVTLEHLMQMDENRNGQVSKREYVEFMMLEMGLVSKDQLDELHEQFQRLDVTNTGYLDVEDLKLMAELRGCTISNVAKAKSQR